MCYILFTSSLSWIIPNKMAAQHYNLISVGQLLLSYFFHHLNAVMEAVDEGFVFIGYADPAAEVEYCVVVIQGQDLQITLQFFEAFPDAWRVVFVGFRIGAV